VRVPQRALQPRARQEVEHGARFKHWPRSIDPIVVDFLQRVCRLADKQGLLVQGNPSLAVLNRLGRKVTREMIREGKLPSGAG
jgi:hypothetical protein